MRFAWHIVVLSVVGGAIFLISADRTVEPKRPAVNIDGLWAVTSFRGLSPNTSPATITMLTIDNPIPALGSTVRISVKASTICSVSQGKEAAATDCSLITLHSSREAASVSPFSVEKLNSLMARGMAAIYVVGDYDEGFAKYLLIPQSLDEIVVPLTYCDDHDKNCRTIFEIWMRRMP